MKLPNPLRLIQRAPNPDNNAANPIPPSPYHPGPNTHWANPDYGAYYANSVAIYAAIKLRADAVSRPPLQIHRQNPDGSQTPIPPSHPIHQLLNRPNPWHTPRQLWQATEIHLNLWGQAFWLLDRSPTTGQRQLWPLRPDRIAIIPHRQNHIQGFLYRPPHSGAPIPYTPDQILWLRNYNPLDEHAGLSPLAPARLPVEMARDGLRYNRSFLQNSAQPDYIILTDNQLTDHDINDFYHRWETRHRGPHNARRPAIANFIRDIKPLGLSHRDMDFIQSLRWSLEEVSRAYGVPKPLLSDLERATFANINAAERIFWRNTIVPQLHLLAEQLNHHLLPKLGYQNLQIHFDLTSIEALQEDQNKRVQREIQLLDRGVLTINELRQNHHLPPVPWGHTPQTLNQKPAESPPPNPGHPAE